MNYFGVGDELDSLRRECADSAGRNRLQALVRCAWYLRRCDSRESLDKLAQAEALLDPSDDSRDTAILRARMALTRAETSWWLFDENDSFVAETMRALHDFSRLDDSLGIGDCHVALSFLHNVLCESALRAQATESALIAYEKAGDDIRRRVVLLMRALWDAYDDPVAAEQKWLSVLQPWSQPDVHPGVRMLAHGTLGGIFANREPAKAIRHFQQAWEDGTLAGDLVFAPAQACNVGRICASLGAMDMALEWSEKGLGLARATGWPRTAAFAKVQSGGVLNDMERHGMAAVLLEEAREVLRAYPNRAYALSCRYLADAYLGLDRVPESLALYEESEQLGKGSGQADVVLHGLLGQASALGKLGHVDRAMALAKQGLGLAEERKSAWHQVLLLQALAGLAKQRSPASTDVPELESVGYLEQALQVAESSDGYGARPQLYSELAARYEAAGDFQRALQLERSAARARHEGASKRAADLAVVMQIRYETDQARAEAQHHKALAELAAARADAERHKMQNLLVHAGKLATVGRLASGIIHEIGHPVGSLGLSLGVLDQLLKGDRVDDARSLVPEIGHEVERLKALLHRLRNMARADPPRLSMVPVHAVLSDARKMFGPRAAAERVHYDEDVGDVEVLADAELLGLTVANIVANAMDAMAGLADRHICVSAEVEDAWVYLSIADSGPGLPPQAENRLFTPFYTTKPAGEGLGLGLALCSEYLAVMGARIEASDRHEGGAVFRIAMRARPEARPCAA